MKPPQKGDVLSRRYRIVELLGAGGMGRVYRAVDERDGSAVAVKTLNVETAGDDKQQRRFEREIRSLQRLAHPHILAYRDHGREAETLYLVTELLDGRTLAEAAADFRGRADNVFLLGARLAAAFGAAHRAGVIHRDIKPANLVITTTGEPRILDYGLARWETGSEGTQAAAAPTAEPLTATNALLGTVPYMSPEQIRSEAVDRRSDVFSLAVVLYELAAGVRPYAAATPLDLLRTIETGNPTPLGDADPALRRTGGMALDMVLRKALRADTRERFQTMDEFKDALERGLELCGAAERDTALAVLLPPTVSGAKLGRGSLFGRDRELSALREAMHRARDSRGSALVLEGYAGSGRSRLAEEALRVAHGEGFLCLTASARGSGTAERVQAPVDQWLARAREVFPEDATIERAMAERAPSSSGSSVGALRPPGHKAAPVLASLEALSQRMPLLLLLEDIEEAVPETLDLLARLVPVAAEQRMLLVTTLRTDAPTRAATETALHRLLENSRLTRVELGPLGPEDLRAMAEESYPGIDVPEAMAHELSRRSGGNPLFARAILRELEQRGSLVREGGDWILEDPVGPLPAPAEAAKILEERLASLGEEDRDLLHAAAALGDRVRAERVAELIGWTADQVEIRLRVLARRQRVVITDDEGFRFDRAMTRTTLLAALAPEPRSALHLQAARTLQERLGPRPTPADLAEVAHHFVEAREPQEALPFCVRAGLGLRDAGSPDAAAAWLDRARVILERQIESVDENDRSPLRVQLADVDLGLAECLEGIGRHDEALEIFDKARGLGIAEELGPVQAQAAIGLARSSLARGDVLRAQRQARNAKKIAQRHGLERERALALSAEAHALSRSDENDTAEQLWAEAAEVLESLGHTEDAAETLFRLGSHHYRLGAYDRAREGYDRAASCVGRKGSPRLYARIQNAQAGVLFAEGRPQEALALFQEAFTVRESIGSRRGMAASLHNIAYCHHILGDRREARRIYEQVIALRDEVGEAGRKTDSQRNYAEVLLGLGEIETALGIVTETIAAKRRLEDVTLLPPSLNLLGEIELELGRSQRARDAFAEIVREFPEHRNDVFIADVGLARVEALSGNPQGAAERLERALAGVPDGVPKLERLKACYELARLVRTTGGDATRVDAIEASVVAVQECEREEPEAGLYLRLAAAEIDACRGGAAEAREQLALALEASWQLGTVERTWRIHRDLARLLPEGTEERAAQTASAQEIVAAQALRLSAGEMREAYLAHRERTEIEADEA